MRSQRILVAALVLFSLLSFSAASEASAQDCPACLTAPQVVLGDNSFGATGPTCNVPSSVGCGSFGSSNTRFFSFTPAVSGYYSISSCRNATPFPPHTLSVWGGCNFSDLIVCGGTACSGGGARLDSVQLDGGRNYRIGIGTYPTYQIGSGILTIEPGSSESADCPSCLTAPAVFVGDNAFVAGGSECDVPGSAACSPWGSQNTRFFSFTPSVTGAYYISTCRKAAGLPPHFISVWDGCDFSDVIVCGELYENECSGGGSFLDEVVLEAGRKYRIGLGTLFSYQIGSGFLTIEPINSVGATCESPKLAELGVNNFNTSSCEEVVDLGGLCDPLPQGGPWDDRIHNVFFFSFTPPESGVYSFTTCGTVDVLTRMAILQGCSPDSGVIGCTDGSCPNSQPFGSRIIGANLLGGVEYRVLVGGVRAEDSPVGSLRVSVFEPCVGPKPTVSEFEACGEVFDFTCAFAEQTAPPIAAGDVIRGRLWAVDGMRDVDVYQLDIVEGTAVTLSLHAAIDASAILLEGDCTAGVWAPQTRVGCPGNSGDPYCLAPGRYYIAVAPGQYWNHPCGYAAGNEYTLTVTGEPCDASPPPNDFCADAIAVTEGATPFDNDFATTDVPGAVCPAPVLKDVWFTFTATKAGDHLIRTCNGADPFNTGMDIWTACPSAGGEVLACNDNSFDDACGDYSSSVVLAMTAGQTVYIRIGSTLFFDAWTGASELVIESLGDEVVCGDPQAGDCCVARESPFCSDTQCCNSVCAWDPTCCSTAWDQSCVSLAALHCFSCAAEPENNGCENAEPAIIGQNPFRNRSATGSTETSCGAVRSDVWFSFTATSEQPVTVSFCDADGGWAYVTSSTEDLDTMIAVLDGCSGNVIACNDNVCGTRSKVTFDPTCGGTYLIVIGSRTDDKDLYSQGIGSFTITQSGTCGNGCPADIDGDGEVSSSDLGALLSAWGTAGADLDGDGETGSSDLGVLLSAWGPCG